MNRKAFNLESRRDFGELIQDSIQFVIANARTYIKPIVLFAGPLYLITAIFNSIFLKDYYENFTELINGIAANPSEAGAAFEDYLAMTQSPEYAGYLGLSMIGAVIGIAAILVVISISIGVVISYQRNPEEEMSMGRIKELVSSYFWKYLGLTAINFLLFLAVYIAGILVVIMAAGVLKVAGGVIAGIGLLVAIFYILVIQALSYPIMMGEQVGPVKAIQQSFKLIKGSWWETFGLIVVSYLVSMMVSLLVMGLAMIVGSFFGDMGSGGFMMSVGLLINSLVGAILTAFVLTAMTFQYFNLKAKKEAPASMSQIDDIGREEKPEEEDLY